MIRGGIRRPRAALVTRKDRDRLVAARASPDSAASSEKERLPKQPHEGKGLLTRTDPGKSVAQDSRAANQRGVQDE